ncbi:MAG TPA: DUF3558 family protein, partial [Pseudonocardiaceae bacterium]|nr:DUF3558 family protein [Pseudonocardiaceae bacterium]
PLDVAKVTNDPCSGLTAAQLAPYMGTLQRSTKSQYNNGTGCLFEPADGHQAGIGVLVCPSNSGPGTLTQSGFPWQEPAGDIAGYPAEHQSQGGASGPATGDCQTMVAVSNQASLAVYIDDSEPDYKYYTDACTAADKLAAELIANIKGGG